MSSVESAPMSSSDVTEKGSIDFGVKAVSLKTQAEANRLLQSGGPLRPLPSSSSISRQTQGYSPQQPPLSSQKTVNFNRVTSGHAASSSSMSSGTAVTAKPPHSTSAVTSTTATLHGSATTYLLPRGGQQHGQGPRGPGSMGRANLSLQPAGGVQTLVRTQSPLSAQSGHMNHMRAPSPGGPSGPGTPRTVVATRTTISNKPGAGHQQSRQEMVRPLVLPSSSTNLPTRPLTLTPTTQLHIATDKTMKVPVGSVTQVLRPTLCSVPVPFVGQNQAAILQRSDGVTLQGAPAAVLTTPVRLTPPLTPLLTTQRVAVSVGTRLGMQQHVTVAGSIPAIPRLPSPGVGVGNRGGGPNHPSHQGSGPISSKIGVSPLPVSSTIITTGRATYATGPLVTGAAPISRVGTQGTMTAASNKATSGTAMVTTASRGSFANHMAGHAGGKPRFVRPHSGPPSTSAPPGPHGPTGLLVHSQISQLVVSSGNHVTTALSVRPPMVTNANAATKVIQQPITGSIHLAAASHPHPQNHPHHHQQQQHPGKTLPISLPSSAAQLTTVISKPDGFKQLTAAISMSRVVGPHPHQQPHKGSNYPLSPVAGAGSAGTMGSSDGDHHHATSQASTIFIPATSAHRANPPPGHGSTQVSHADRPVSTPTLNTYTLPSGASYYYEAPSGYQLATDSPLVARPLSPDAPLASRQLATDMIARAYTPATSQTMRFNPVMIVDSVVTSSSNLPAVAVTSAAGSSEGSAGSASDPSAAKLTSSPRPSILRKRDNDGNINSKVVKNLTAALSGTCSRSRTPSPPTPPTSLHLETNQTCTGTDVGPSSNGSTTISATSSPGPEEAHDPDRPTEMSPRKKPRKQLLNEAANDSIDMEFISEERMKKEKEAASARESCTGGGGGESEEKVGEGKVFVVKRPPSVSLLRQYKHNWKARNNHFQRYADVKVREERRPSVTELASQKQVVQRVKGWKVYHLSTQFEDLSDMETCVLDRLSTIFKAMDTNLGKEFEKDVNRVNELIMGNIQRSKVIRDQMTEAKLQMMKGFDHKVHVSEIISRCASKRNFKKRDKY